jgi:GNAT superfamily N-acetyltransferase
MKQEAIAIKMLQASDIQMIVESFAKFDWHKPTTTFEKYHREQTKSERLVWLAFYEGAFAGYVTLKFASLYPPFKDQNIPEIMDLNVLPPYRAKGIGTKLLQVAECEAANNYPVVGLGVGLYRDYGNAQRLYVKHGYLPDGQGVTYSYEYIKPGVAVCLDDDLLLWFTKRLN